jgi:hypothetical protein
VVILPEFAGKIAATMGGEVADAGKDGAVVSLRSDA